MRIHMHTPTAQYCVETAKQKQVPEIDRHGQAEAQEQGLNATQRKRTESRSSSSRSKAKHAHADNNESAAGQSANGVDRQRTYGKRKQASSRTDQINLKIITPTHLHHQPLWKIGRVHNANHG